MSHNRSLVCRKPHEEFAKMIERHWDGIVAYRRPENKVSWGFVEGLYDSLFGFNMGNGD